MQAATARLYLRYAPNPHAVCCVDCQGRQGLQCLGVMWASPPFTFQNESGVDVTPRFAWASPGASRRALYAGQARSRLRMLGGVIKGHSRMAPQASACVILARAG